MRSILRLVLPVLGLCAAAPAGAAPHLVKDLNPGPSTEDLPRFSIGISAYSGITAAHGGLLYFTATDPAHGSELWRTDGTDAGTVRLTDVCPGRCASRLSNLAFLQDLVFFTADDGSSGNELWVSDGTPGSERRVLDLCPGPCPGVLSNLVPLDGGVYFLATRGQDLQLWRSDGSPDGTSQVATICPESGCTSYFLARLGGRLLFTVSNADATVLSVWSSDGTAAGTGPIDFPRGVSGLFVDGDHGYFFTADDLTLWRTDGTAAGTVQVRPLRDLLPDPFDLFDVRGAVWDGTLFLFLQGRLAVRSDGTPGGTVRLQDFPLRFHAELFAPLDSGLLVVADDEGLQNTIWRLSADGTREKIFDLGTTSLDFADGIVPLGSRAVFRVYRNATRLYEVWTTDGTPAGTHKIESAPSDREGAELFAAGTEAYFVAEPADSISSSEVWRTDGTEAGTVRVHDFGDVPASSGPLAQAALGGALVFSAQLSRTDAPLFRTDGTAAGTLRLSGKAPWGQSFTSTGNRLFFRSEIREPFFGTDVLHTTPNGLWRVEDRGSAPPRVASVAPKLVTFGPLAALGETLLFAGADSEPQPYGGPDVELWASDGKSAARVKNINPFLVETGFHHICVPGGSTPGPGAVIKNRLLVFAAEDGLNGRELWASDGTKAGTRLVRDINPARSPFPPASDCDDRPDTGLSSDPQDLVTFRQGALFTADDGVHGREIWWTNGTAAGTRLVRDLRPGAASAAPHVLTALGDAVYFFAALPAAGEGLWRTDGTAPGTVLVHDLTIGGKPSWPRSLTAVGPQLFFVVYNESTGAELWTSRGTAATTHPVIDLRPGPLGSSPQELAAIGNALVFAATDGVHGVEPWRSDGTSAGTRPLGDLNPGLDASSPGPFTRAGSFVFTGAYDAEHGREPWAIPLAEVLP
jgi:ELWxxDGT repeat protein